MSTSSGGAPVSPAVSSQEIEALLKQVLRRITYTTVEEYEAAHAQQQLPSPQPPQKQQSEARMRIYRGSVRAPGDESGALASPRLGGSLREPGTGAAALSASRRALRRTVTFVDDAGRVSNVAGVGRKTMRRLANTVSPPVFTGRDFVDQLAAAARGRPRAECARLAQAMLARGAITAVSLPGSSATAAAAAAAGAAAVREEEGGFDEGALYAARACEELSERQARALVAALRTARCAGDWEGKQGAVVRDAVQGRAAVQCWLADQALFVASRQTAVVLGQELLNKGFLRAVRGCSESFRDSRDLYALAEARPCRYWGTMLKRGNTSRAWNMRWFVCRDVAEKRIWFYQTPQHARPKKCIDLAHACVRTAATDPLCFDICTPTRIWEMRALSTVTMAAWLGVIATMAGEVAEDNRLLDSPEELIVAAQQERCAAWLQNEYTTAATAAGGEGDGDGTLGTGTAGTTRMVLVPSHSPFYEGTTLDNPPHTSHNSDDTTEQKRTETAAVAQCKTTTVHVTGFRAAPECLRATPSDVYPCVRTVTPTLRPDEVVTSSAFSAMTNSVIIATSARALYTLVLDDRHTTEQILLTDETTEPQAPVTKIVSCVVTGNNGTTTEFFWCIDNTGMAYIWDNIRQTLQGRHRIADAGQRPVIATNTCTAESAGTRAPVVLTAGPRPGTITVHHICTDDQSPQFGTVAATTPLQIPDCTHTVTAMGLAPNGTLWVIAGSVYLCTLNNSTNLVFKKLEITDDCIRCSLSPAQGLFVCSHKEAWTVHTRGEVAKWDIENGKERHSTAYVAQLRNVTPNCFLLYDGSLLMDSSTENNSITRVSRFARTTEQITFDGAQTVTVLGTNTKRDTLSVLLSPSSTQQQCTILLLNIATTCPTLTTK